jgi:hypothetical protein
MPNCRHSFTNQRFQSWFSDLVALGEIDGSRGFGIQTGVEESGRIFQRSAFEEIQLHMVLERTRRADKSIACVNRGVPFPLLSDLRRGLQD